MTAADNEQIPCEVILGDAAEANLKHLLVVGVQQDGSIYVSGSDGDIGSALLLMERAKRFLVDLLEASIEEEKNEGKPPT